MRLLNILLLIFFLGTADAQDHVIYRGDTVNLVDENNRKQGEWVEWDNTTERVLEKGAYVDGVKEGAWVYYYSNGIIKNEITYKKGKAIGPACFYYPDGKISEKGFWNVDHWEGAYKFYHRSGQLAYDWQYDTQGKRTGVQKYYHENGRVKYTGLWEKGKTTGALKMYDENGQLINERIYDEVGKFASNQTKTVSKQGGSPAEEHHYQEFKGTGMHTIFNLHGKPEKKGFFIKGKLYNGDEYTYNAKGELLEVKHYENGKLKISEDLKNPV